MKAAFLILCLSLLVGCAMPATRVQTVDDRPSISVHGAPRGAMLYVDGLPMGPADQYRGVEVLRLEPGIHEVQLVLDSVVIFTQRIFLGSAHKDINVH
jgi:hypothetical protein